MNTTSKFALAALALALSASGAGVASAQGLGVSVQASLNAGAGANASATGTVKADKSTSTDKATTTRGNGPKASATTTASTSASATTTRGSAVSAFVKSLLAVADREGGIGAQVRTVAQSQNESASTTAAAKAKVEGRGSLRAFLAGSDYQSLKAIRGEIATTTANIERLKGLRDQATTVEGRAELSAQIAALEADLAQVTAFVEAREGRFSLFGWFNRLFAR